MKHITCLILATMLFSFATAARAADVDMSKMTCGDLLDMKSDDMGAILIWLHGYFGGLAKDPMIDLSGFPEFGRALGTYCAEHKKQTLFTAIKALAN